MEENQLDALVSPGHTEIGIPAKAGYPYITVPVGYTKKGEPLGLTFTGMAFTEAKLIFCQLSIT